MRWNGQEPVKAIHRGVVHAGAIARISANEACFHIYRTGLAMGAKPDIAADLPLRSIMQRVHYSSA